MFAKLPRSLKIVELGLRDGLQNEKTILPTPDKLQFLKLLLASGLQRIEITSFVRKDRIPQMGDCSELMDLALPLLKQLPPLKAGQDQNEKQKQNQIEISALVANVKGMETAIAHQTPSVAVVTATSNTMLKKNINRTITESKTEILEILKIAKAAHIPVRGYISTVFGCPYEGQISADVIKDIVNFYLENHVFEISLGDTIGIANPLQVQKVIQSLKAVCPLDKMAMHFHDTRGLALANVVAALEEGVVTFDSSAGGLGGCPFAKGATGNLATEDLLRLAHTMGIETGVDEAKLVEASLFIHQKLAKIPSSKELSYQMAVAKDHLQKS
jgi:hydroxymethylglutaryl-CoA lyase